MGRNREGNMENQVILFGSGEIGTEAFTFFGGESVAYFCDNDLDIAGTRKCGKRIISFLELKEKFRDSLVVISANRVNSDGIVRQCEENGIRDYLVYERLREKFEKREELLSFIREPSNRLQLKMELYQDKVSELRQEVGYFKSHADIRAMKPAEGKLRERQLRTARASAELFSRLSHLQIKPYLTGGNLLGYMRHGGVIPWDDDIDFDLIRDEFERLKTYCMAHMDSKQEFEARKAKEAKKISEAKEAKGPVEDKKSQEVKENQEAENKNADGFLKSQEQGLERYYWADWLHHFQVNVTFPDGDSIGVDFFPIDYYGEDCSFNGFMDLVKGTKQEWESAAGSAEKRAACIQAAKRENQKNTVKESSRVYFGADNLANFRSYHRGGWIPKDVVFPLKQVLYEGEYFWVPNDADEYVKYLFKTIWTFPGDNIAIPKHYQRHKLMDGDV